MPLLKRSTILTSLVVGAMFASLFSGSVFSGSAAAADTTGPTLDLHPGLRFVVGRQLSDSGPDATIRARITWTRSDASGICRQRVRIRDLETDHARTWIVPRATKRQGFDFVVDRGYRVNVKITDCAGNSTSTAGRYEAQLLQEDTAYLDPTDEWTSISQESASGGTLIRGDSGAQSVVFGVARSVALVAKKSPGLGTTDVSSRNDYGVVDLDGPRRVRVVVYQDRWREPTDYDNVILEINPIGTTVIDAYLVG